MFMVSCHPFAWICYCFMGVDKMARLSSVLPILMPSDLQCLQCCMRREVGADFAPTLGYHEGALNGDSMINVLNHTVETLTATVGSLKRSNELLKLQLVTKDNRASRLELELATIQLETLHRGQREESRSKARD